MAESLFESAQVQSSNIQEASSNLEGTIKGRTDLDYRDYGASFKSLYDLLQSEGLNAVEEAYREFILERPETFSPRAIDEFMREAREILIKEKEKNNRAKAQKEAKEIIEKTLAMRKFIEEQEAYNKAVERSERYFGSKEASDRARRIAKDFVDEVAEQKDLDIMAKYNMDNDPLVIHTLVILNRLGDEYKAMVKRIGLGNFLLLGANILRGIVEGRRK